MNDEVMTTTALNEDDLKKLKECQADDYPESRSVIQFLHNLIKTNHEMRFSKK